MIRDPEQLRALVDSVDRFVRDRLLPAEPVVEETDDIPADIIQDMRELGLFGLTVPEEYGGLGLTTEEEAHVIIALSWASPAYRSLIGTTVGIGTQGIVIDGTPEQKARFLPQLASGEKIASFCLTEPDSGSDAGSLRTRAVRDGDHYIVNGTKRFITNAPHAGLFTLMARTDPNEKGAAGVSAFIVDADSPGIRFGRKDAKMGMRGAHTCDVIFEDVRVPADRIIGGVEGQGFKTAMKVLDKGRIHIGMICVGAAKRILDEALRYAMERRQFGQPIANFQLVQAMLADSRAELYAAECMVMDAARRRDAGESISTEAAATKLFCSEMVGRVADRALQILGGAGYTKEYVVERFYRDVRLFRIYEGTSQIQQLVIARNMIRQGPRVL
jgi:acyl-CoA dehydrogenase